MLRDDHAQQQQQFAPPLPQIEEPTATINTTTNGAASVDDWETQDPSAHTVPSAASVQAATQAFGKMRIMQPAPTPAQDGGVYDRVLADAQPVSAATASAASAHALDGTRGPLDPVLVACLDNSRERLTLLKFEDQIVRFMKNPREAQLVLPPLSSYHRLIVHRLAERCCLEHQTAEYNPYAAPSGGYDGNSARAVTLFKTAQSIVPSVLLIDLSADRHQQTAAPASVPKIMVRKRAGPRPGAHAGRGAGDAKNAQRSMQDRERAYAEARARIFGEDSASESSAPSSSSTTVAPAGGGGGASQAATSKLNANSQQASGPDGSRGFGGRGRGGRGGVAAERSPRRQHEQSSELARSDSGSSSSSIERPTAVRAQSTHNWKESKVLWRNREQELNDPDFTRHHDAYRQARSGGGGGGVTHDATSGYNRYPPPPVHHQMGRYSGAPPPMEFYDNSAPPPRQPSPQQQQQFGYAVQQPPLPGRRPPPGEFSRLDTAGNMRPPPPPPDHFRGGRYPLTTNPPMPPPSMPMGMPRGSYGYHSPQHARPYHSSPSPVRNGGSNGGYNDDFPPLGK